MEPLTIAYAGSLTRLVEEDLAPSWQSLTGRPARGTAGGSCELARRLCRGELRADVFLTADEQVIVQEWRGWGVHWYLRFATTELGFVYRPASRFEEAFVSAAAGLCPWWEALRQPGLRLGRPDPDVDPKGYRTLFVFQLSGVAGLRRAVLGADRNPAQLLPAGDLFAHLRAGEIDACPAYRNQAVEEGLPFLSLPEEVNLGEEKHAERYPRARYVAEDGAEYRGAPIRYAAALPGDPVSASAAEFLLFLTQPEAQAALAAHGFRPANRLCRARIDAEGERGSALPDLLEERCNDEGH